MRTLWTPHHDLESFLPNSLTGPVFELGTLPIGSIVGAYDGVWRRLLFFEIVKQEPPLDKRSRGLVHLDIIGGKRMAGDPEGFIVFSNLLVKSVIAA